jgi:prophage regulatory protein
MHPSFSPTAGGIDMESFLRFPAVLAKTGLSRSTIYLKISRGEFPAPVKLGQRAVGWPETAIARWIAASIDATPPTDYWRSSLTSPRPRQLPARVQTGHCRSPAWPSVGR